MKEEFGKRQIYEFCETKNQMVRLDVIQSTITMPDLAQAEIVLVPMGCNRQEQCKIERVSCLVYDKDHGADPCPDVWRGEV